MDRQLAGRCARQGQPGSTVFFVSADDHLVKMFAPLLAKQLARITAAEDGRLPDDIARLFFELQVQVQKTRDQQWLPMEKCDQWMDQTRKSLA
ncbi:MAG: hypothetical protein ACOYOF_00925 [Verrucomicrobiaceae bacterium]